MVVGGIQVQRVAIHYFLTDATEDRYRYLGPVGSVMAEQVFTSLVLGFKQERKEQHGQE